MKRSPRLVASRAKAKRVDCQPWRIQASSGAKQVVTSSSWRCRARLGGGRLVELLEPGAEGVEADAQHGDQGGHDTVEATPLGEDHAEAVEGQDGGLGPRELGKASAT